MGLTAGILGASGYAGGELLRLLARHPAFEVGAVAAGRAAGETVGKIHPHLGPAGGDFVTVDRFVTGSFDVVFSCLPSGELGPIAGSLSAHTIVDLSDEHRASRKWVYGLTEMTRDRLPASRVANPGCYPTAVFLGIAPFLKAGLVEGPVIVDAMSGVSGAGRKTEDRLLFAGLHGDAMPYGTTDHRHVAEMQLSLGEVSGGDVKISFTPHLVPIARGLLATVRAQLAASMTDEDVLGVLQDAYDSERFVRTLADWPRIKPVVGTNEAHVHARVDAATGFLICAVAIDNLGKGAAGQAVQNANLCFGLPEDAGLDAIGLWP